MKASLYALVTFVALLTAVLLLATPHPSHAADTVYISEFVAEQLKSYADENGDYEDWLELHNPTAAPIDLTGWYLTDDPTNLTLWQIPPLTLNAGQYQVIFASGKNRTGATLHTNFSLSQDGDYLALVQPDGQTIATEFAPIFPPQRSGYSYGTPDGTADLRFMVPTPSTANTAATFTAFEQPPVFSQPHGFYDAPFGLELTAANPSAPIYYTLDGSTPTAASHLYTTTIPISHTTSIRAIATYTGHITSTVATQSYLFLDDIITQYADGTPPPGWPAHLAVKNHHMNYGMDPDITNTVTITAMKQALTAISTLSIVTDLPNLVDPTIGIYVNPGQRGFNWERPTSIELIWPDGSEGFQINAGLRIRGGASRSATNPKHAFRFFFRNGYDDGPLQYPIFEDEGAAEFSNLDLRSEQNYSWAFANDAKNTLLRDVFWRDLMGAQGQPYTRSRYHHLYINGVYWGIYMTEERPEAAYGETYFGGDAANYDTIKSGGSSVGYVTEATDGNLNGAWLDLWNLSRAQHGNPTLEGYMAMQGLNPDGTRNPALPVLLDADNLIDYMLSLFYVGAADNALSWFLSTNPYGRNGGSNNWFAMRDSTNPDMGFQFFAHDGEHSTGVQATNGDPTFNNRVSNADGSPFRPDQQVLFNRSNPQFLHQDLLPTAEYRLNFADRVHEMMFNGGLMTPTGVMTLIQPRRDTVAQVILAESARWGDSKRAVPFTVANWNTAANNMVNYLVNGQNIPGYTSRTAQVLDQLRLVGLYPSVVAPSFNQHGGLVPVGFELAMSTSQPSATIYYMADGRDPRQIGGAIHPEAQIYTGQFELTADAHIKARAMLAGEWSALNHAPFTLNDYFPPTPGDLVVSEINYNPAGTEEYEFIEFRNNAPHRLDLSGVQIVAGVVFTFPEKTLLPIGQHILVVEEPSFFASRYQTPSLAWHQPNLRLAGEWEGALNNMGEELAVLDAFGVELLRFSYDDGGVWPGRADDEGSSAELIDPTAAPTTQPALNTFLADGANWRPTSEYHGSPGRVGLGPDNRILFNEILAHGNAITPTIELYNTTAAPLDLSHWFISDSTVYTKHQILPGTIITAGGFLAISTAELGFDLLEVGGDLYLLEADSDGNLLRFVEDRAYNPTYPNEAIGYLPDGTGDYVRLCTPSLGASNANSGFCHGPVVINELYYQPSGGAEYIELYNFGSQSESLGGWQLRGGIAFDFGGSAVIPANSALLVVGFNPSNTSQLNAFRAHYQVAMNVPIVGPWTGGTLPDGGAEIRLERLGSVAHLPEDRAIYQTTPPWPTEPAGNGRSLELRHPSLDNRDGASWEASLTAKGTAGRHNDDDFPAASLASPAEVNEGATAWFTVTLAHASGMTITVDYATVNGTAVAGQDFVPTNGTLTFAPGQTSQTISVTLLADGLDEPNETLAVWLSNPNRAYLGQWQGTAVIGDGDPAPLVHLGGTAGPEGDSGTTPFHFPITLTAPSGYTVTAVYETVPQTAVSPDDFISQMGVITFAPGITQTTIPVLVVGDVLDEPDETFTVRIITATHATLGQSEAIGTIEDDDEPPLVSLGSGSVLEGETAVLTATLSAPSSFTITVEFASADDTAVSGTDYEPISGTLTFAPGQTSHPLTVTALLDGLDEPQETFSVTLASPSHATLGTAEASVIILDVDGPPALSVEDVTTAEGDTTSKVVSLTVHLLPASGQVVAVDYVTGGGTAVVGLDYEPISGTLTFAPGETSQIITVTMLGNALYELDKTVGISLSNPANAELDKGTAVLTIANDDAAPTVAVEPEWSVVEGDAGLTAVVVTVTLSAPSGLSHTVDFATADGSAVAGMDYQAAGGTLFFAAGQTTQTITLSVRGNTTHEADKQFGLVLIPTAPLFAGNLTATITIVNDDEVVVPPPPIPTIYLPLVVRP
ncbi:MAG: lamin tail domain-containing protein [Chloroflexi bacterium]|nr:lamin tail domain-containing protein [Chloroflexota bacterium]